MALIYLVWVKELSSELFFGPRVQTTFSWGLMATTCDLLRKSMSITSLRRMTPFSNRFEFGESIAWCRQTINSCFRLITPFLRELLLSSLSSKSDRTGSFLSFLFHLWIQLSPLPSSGPLTMRAEFVTSLLIGSGSLSCLLFKGDSSSGLEYPCEFWCRSLWPLFNLAISMSLFLTNYLSSFFSFLRCLISSFEVSSISLRLMLSFIEDCSRRSLFSSSRLFSFFL